jgi:linoleate 10R-lipoxygenase
LLSETTSIGNLVHAHFSSELFDIPLETQDNPHGVFTDQEFYEMNAVLFAWVFLDAEPVKSFQLRQAARVANTALSGIVEPLCTAIKSGKLSMHLKGAIHKDQGLGSIYGCKPWEYDLRITDTRQAST